MPSIRVPLIARLPSLILNPRELLGTACMQAVLEEDDGHAANVAYRGVYCLVSGFGIRVWLPCHRLVIMPPMQGVCMSCQDLRSHRASLGV